MKKLLIVLSFLLSANFMIAQSISLNLPEIDMTGKVPGDKIDIDIYIDAMTPAAQIWGFQLFFNVPAGSLTWDGTINVPMPGVLYLNPLFGTTIGAFQMNFVNNQMGWLWGDGGSYVILDGQTFPVKIATLRFTYQNPPLLGPLSWQITKGVDNGGWMVKGKSDVYYNDFFESFPEQTYADGSMFIPSGGTPGLWTGAVSSEWDDAGNWDDGNVPPPGINIEIPNVGKAFFPVILGGPIIIGNLTMMPLSVFTIAPGGQVTTNGVFTNIGGSFRILSDNTGKSGSYIDNGLPGGIVGLGGATFEFDRNTWWNGDPTPFGDWHYISSPMGNTGAYGPTSGFENWDFLDYFALTWNAGLGAWAPMGGGAPNCVPAPWAPIQGMDAWAINWDPTYTSQGCPGGVNQFIQMVGDFNLMQWAPINAPAVVGPGGGNPPFGPGWNMYGNPYPSALLASGLNYAGFQQGVAMYDPQIDNYVYSTLGNLWFAGNIAPTQGFFVQANVPGAFGVAHANKTHDPNVIWKSESGNLLTLEATGNNRSDKLWVNVDLDGALAGYDNVGDFSKLFSSELPQIYTVAENQKLAVNALPATPSVPMEFTSGTSGTYTIAAIETSEFENVVLEDLANGMQTDLLAGSYTFEYSEGAVHNFVIHFTPLGTPELNANSINIWAADQNIYVQAPATTGDIVVYNLMGQEVLRTDIEAGLNVIPMTDVNTYYIVKVIGSDVTETGKVFIK